MPRAGGYSLAERRADGAIHVLGLAFVAVAVPILIFRAAMAAAPWALGAGVTYTATLTAMIAASAAYNLAPETLTGWRMETLRRVDHAMIFMKIAGTYTPFALISLAGGSGRWLLLAVWSVALIGAAVKIAAPRRLELVSVPLYLALGWSFVWVATEATAAIQPAALSLLAVGGVVYTIGIVFHLWDALPFQNAIWHLHVLIATACMYAAVSIELI